MVPHFMQYYRDDAGGMVDHLLVCELLPVPKLLPPDTTQAVEILVAQWLNRCTAAKTVLTTWVSIPGSWLKVDSAFYPSEVDKMST